MQAPPEKIAKYKGVYDVGWEVIREQRLNRLKQLGLVDPNLELSPLDSHSWQDEPDRKTKGEDFKLDSVLCWEHETNRAVRKGRWKLESKGELQDGS